MSVTYSTFGITIDRLDFGETSQVVHFLTEDSGRLALLAKGAHRAKNPFGGSIDLLVYARITASHRPRSSGLDLLHRTEVLTHFPGIRKDWSRYATTNYLMELVREGVPEKERIPGLFRLFRAALVALNDRPFPELMSIVLAFEWRLLKMIGLSPELDRCVQCGREVKAQGNGRGDWLAFCMGGGGVMCDPCAATPDRLSMSVWRALKALETLTARELSLRDEIQRVLPDLRGLLDRYWTFHLERPLDGAPWLREMLPSYSRIRASAPLTFVFLVGAMLFGVSCSSVENEIVEGRRVSELSGNEVLAEVRRRLDASEFEEALELALYTVRSYEDPDVIEEARLLAGESELGKEELVSAFRHYKTLLQDRPLTRFRTPFLKERIFDLGLALYNLEPGWFSDHNRCVEVFNFFGAQYPKSDEADEALRLVAQYYMDNEEYELAIERYQKLYRDFPDREWRELAQYRIGVCYVELCPGPKYDRVLMLRGRQIFTDYLNEYPSGGFAEEARTLRGLLDSWLAQREMSQASLYELRDQERGMRLHLSNVVLVFPQSPEAQEARSILAARGWDTSIHAISTFELDSGLFGDPYDDQWVGLSGAAERGFF